MFCGNAAFGFALAFVPGGVAWRGCGVPESSQATSKLSALLWIRKRTMTIRKRLDEPNTAE